MSNKLTFFGDKSFLMDGNIYISRRSEYCHELLILLHQNKEIIKIPIIDIDSKPFNSIRRLIIILFIFFEISALILLTKNLFKFKEELKKYINPLILKIKIVFVITVFFITCVAFIILVFGDPSTAFKHTLEWNYFTFLLLYYLFSRLLWRCPLKPRSHTRRCMN